jgi:Ca2+-binding EF-hand superfamily protein
MIAAKELQVVLKAIGRNLNINEVSRTMIELKL